MRFKGLVHQFRHQQLPRPMLVVGAHCGWVKTALHALFEKSAWAKHLLHQRFRRFIRGPSSGTLPRDQGSRGVILELHILALGGLGRTLYLRPRGIPRRIGCALCQKSAFTPQDEQDEPERPVTITYPFAPLSSAARPHRGGDCISVDSGHLRVEHSACFCCTLALFRRVTFASGDRRDRSVFLSRDDQRRLCCHGVPHESQ